MNAIDLYKQDKRDAVAGYVITILVHIALFVLLWFAVIMPPNPPLSELGGGSGMEISLGAENMGGPDLIPVQEVISAEPTPPQPEQPVEETQTLTQETEDAPEIEKKEEVKKETPIKKPEIKTEIKKPVTTPIKPVEQPRKVDERSLFKKKSVTGESRGSGDGTVPGNEGRPDGSPGGSPDGNGGIGNGGNGSGFGTGDGTGNGTGDGVGGFDLQGRSLSRRPDVVDNSRETGKVVVQIVVDRTGKVIKATPGYKGTTTLSPVLLEKAKQGAMDAKFSPKPDGPEEQYGTMTFIFKFKP